MKKNGKNNGNPFKDMPNVHVVQIDNEQNRKQAEQAKKQAMYLELWESMTENEYIETVKMINSNQIDSNNQLFKDKDLLEFVKMKIKQGKEQADQESKTFFELLPQMSETVQKSMLEFINDHFTDEQTHIDYVNLVQMARERAVTEHQQEKSKLPSTVQEFWESLTPKVQEEIIESQEVNVQIEIDLEELGIDAYEFADYVFLTIAPQREQEQAEQTKLEQEVIEVQELTEEVNTATEILIQTPTTEIMKTQKEVASEVKKEVSKSEKTTKKEKVVKQKASNETVNNTQNITNNTLNVILDKPKPKMSIADKIVEAQKMLVIAERKEVTEARLKDFHGYLHANKDGDNFTLTSLDKSYSFSTNNAELVKEVNIVLERFLKNKIQEFETELANFQLV